MRKYIVEALDCYLLNSLIITNTSKNEATRNYVPVMQAIY